MQKIQSATTINPKIDDDFKSRNDWMATQAQHMIQRMTLAHLPNHFYKTTSTTTATKNAGGPNEIRLDPQIYQSYILNDSWKKMAELHCVMNSFK